MSPLSADATPPPEVAVFTFLSVLPPFEPELVHGARSRRAGGPGPRLLTTRASCVHGITPSQSPATAAAKKAPTASPSENAQQFAEHALRLLFEVLDRRRAIEQLGTLFAPATVEAARTLSGRPLPGSRLGAASLRRVHVVEDSARSAEVFGSYARGDRMFAVAARIERRNTPRRNSWTVSTFRIG